MHSESARPDFCLRGHSRITSFRSPLMSVRIASLVAILALVGTAPSQGPVAPPGGGEPILRLDAGPRARVTALAFSPDVETLHVGGYDKIVRTWQFDRKEGAFRRVPEATYRVPLGPGHQGDINAIAVSADGKWLAVAGHGRARQVAGHARPGIVVP